MSEEEKQAIERLTFYRDQIKEELYPRIDYEEEKAIGIVLNLLEKQQKEINKAIEYIENAKKELNGCGNYYLSDLLNILKGELNE